MSIQNFRIQRNQWLLYFRPIALGTQAAAAFADPGHKYHDLYQKVRAKITGACSYCAGAYEVDDQLKKADIALIDEFKGHPSFKRLIDDEFTILIFLIYLEEGRLRQYHQMKNQFHSHPTPAPS